MTYNYSVILTIEGKENWSQYRSEAGYKSELIPKTPNLQLISL